MQKNVTRTGKLAFRQGLLFGLSLGIFFIIWNVILSFAKSGTLLLAGGIYTSTSTSEGHGTLIGTGGLLVEILVYLLAGLRASQQTGRVVTGMQAGLWAGLISAIITYVYTVVFLFASASLGQNSQVGELLSTSAILSAIFGMIGIVLALVLGTGVGALGGLIGKCRASPDKVPPAV